MGNDLFYHCLGEMGSSLLISYEINMRANAVRPYKSEFEELVNCRTNNPFPRGEGGRA